MASDGGTRHGPYFKVMREAKLPSPLIGIPGSSKHATQEMSGRGEQAQVDGQLPSLMQEMLLAWNLSVGIGWVGVPPGPASHAPPLGSFIQRMTGTFDLTGVSYPTVPGAVGMVLLSGAARNSGKNR